MKRILIAAFLVTPLTPSAQALEVTSNADVNAQNTNAEMNEGVSTSMNGHTTATANVPISSTSSSAESRSVTGSGN